MAEGRIRLIRAIPGFTSAGPLIAKFNREGGGIITSFTDSLLPGLWQHLGEDDETEVLAFGVLVCRVLAQCGEPVMRLATTAQQISAIGEALKSLPDDSPFARTTRFEGLRPLILSTLKELHAWGIDADEMDALAVQSSERLASKLRSLALIERESFALLRELGRETHGQHLRIALEAFPEEPLDFRILAFIGSELAPQRLRWLRRVAEQGADVTIVCDRHASDGDIFRGSTLAEEMLGAEPSSIGDGHRLLRNLFGVEVHDGPEIEVQISSAADPLAEVEWALRGCLEADPEQGIGLYARNLETYAPLIEMAARRLGVPIRMARRAPLMTNAFVRMTLSVLEFCASQDVRQLTPVLSSSYLGLSGDQQAGLASALRDAHRKRNGQWDELRAWLAMNLEQYGWLMKVLDWRMAAVDTACDLADWTARLLDLVHELPWHAGMVATPGYNPDRDARAFSAMQSVLANDASIERVAEPRTIRLGEFVTRCRSTWEQADVSVPSGEGLVMVSNDAGSLGGAGTVFVLGMLEGVFPRRRSEDPILTDRERAEISTLRPEFPSMLDSDDTAAAERDEFYRVCAVARRKVCFSYPLADDQRDNIPAYYLEVVKSAVARYEAFDRPRPELAPKIEACLSDADRRLRVALDGARETALPLSIESAAVRAALPPAADEAFTPQELRNALRCPFQYVARYRLKIWPRRRSDRWSRLRNLPQAAGLIRQPDETAAEATLQLALDAELDSLYSEVPEWELQLLRSGGRRLIREWLRREFAARKAWTKDSGSVRVNVALGDGLRDQMWGGTRIKGVVPGVSQIDRTKVLQLYGGQAKDKGELSEDEKLFYGLYFSAGHEKGAEVAIEIEGVGSKRSLLLLTRNGTRPLPANVAEGLYVIDLSTTDDPALSKRIFFEEVRRLMEEAVGRIRSGDVRPIKGDHCEWCDYGELCRRSFTFGEDDSPFGPDLVNQDD